MTIKFFPKDVIGTQPTKPGDTFTALFMGRKTLFRVDEMSHGCIMAVLA